eukprot:CAMPEP_0117650144 /NCGR_PEP_ID=MMETSP0804-20121206/1380_1 /TAXON_ID=1074897 /ORGANISM="Tetraselmis astigmatica, Strain CCMP880" /LENGTH=195 /DNA_ID=CAMNT_0005455991 /DNA_START=1813 /DNA_END=2401 /DNA_ORIENTATION=-
MKPRLGAALHHPELDPAAFLLREVMCMVCKAGGQAEGQSDVLKLLFIVQDCNMPAASGASADLSSFDGQPSSEISLPWCVPAWPTEEEAGVATCDSLRLPVPCQARAAEEYEDQCNCTRPIALHSQGCETLNIVVKLQPTKNDIRLVALWECAALVILVEQLVPTVRAGRNSASPHTRVIIGLQDACITDFPVTI